jgi:multidrug efflux pump subunit AcrB
MPRFSIRNPYFIIVICLVLTLIGITSLARMPVDLFPTINLPEVVVATFYSGMPPEDIETDITNPLERFFTLASGIDHMESRSLLGVSIIKVYFQPGTNADADVTQLSNLALADLKRLPPGTLPPVVLKFDAAFWRQVSPGDGLRRPLQAAVAAVERDGCRGRRQQEQPHPSRRRREDGSLRLLRVFE